MQRTQTQSIHTTPSRTRLALVILGLMLGNLMNAVESTIVGTAMPRVIADLNGLDRYAWVFTAYMLASTVVIPIYGKLSDIYGRRPFFLGGMFVFMIGSALSGASQDMTQLILARAVQGLGAGAMMPLSQAIVGDIFPPRERGKWQGVIMSLWGLGTIFGPSLGGWITDHWGWRWVFYLNMPVGALAILAAGIALPALTRYRRHTSDYRGAAVLVLWTVAFLLALSWGGTTFPWLSIQVIGLLAFAVMMLGVFLRIEERAAEPIIRVALFKNSIFAVSVIATFLLSAGMFSQLQYPPLFVQGVIGASATASGAVMTPHMMAFMAMNILGGQLLSRTGRYKLLALSAYVFVAVGMILLARLNVDSTVDQVVRNMVFTGLGIGMGTIFTIIVQNAFAHSELGQVTATLQFFRSMGSTMGTAVLGTVMVNGFQDAFHRNLPAALGQALPADRLADFQNPQVLLTPAATMKLQQDLVNYSPQGKQLFDQLIQVIRASLSNAITNVFLVCAVFMILGLVATLFLKEIPLRTTLDTPEPAPAWNEREPSLD